MPAGVSADEKSGISRVNCCKSGGSSFVVNNDRTQNSLAFQKRLSCDGPNSLILQA
jgi:hypothetical protein